MRSLKSIYPALATGGVLAALGVTAAPLVSVWLRADTPASLSVPALAADKAMSQQATFGPQEVIVDLRDDATDADVRDLDARFGVDLKPNSLEASADRVYRATLPAGVDEANLLARLHGDSRVEAAEPDLTYSIPEPDQARDKRGVLQDGTRYTEYGGYTICDRPALTKIRARMQAAQGDTIFPEYRGEVSPAQQIGNSATPGNDALAYAVTPWHGAACSSCAPPPGFVPFSPPNDPRYNEQWNFRMVGAEEAWTRTRGKGVVVAVIDTGVSIGPSKKGEPCRDFDTTAFTAGYDFVNKDSDPYDDHSHGTHVAGTIAESTNNNEGVAGLAYEATIMPLKVLSASGSGSAADIADAIRFAADHGANIINMSLGSRYPSDVIHNACKYAAKKGVVIVCAAGNGFGEPVGYPAAFKECIAVSSVGPTGQIAKYSSYGKQVALAAPGGDKMDSGNPADGILQNTNQPESQGGNGDSYYSYQGTSMASPHVAAVAALIMSQGVTDPARVRELLTKTATPNGDANKYGAGILSASHATARAAQINGLKLRHFLAFGLGFLLLAVGGRRRSLGLRLAMGAALAVGMFGPDWFAARVGADSAWNLLAFSALAPIALYAALRRGPGVKIAGALALGTAVCLYANWHNDTLPFTSATFGETAPLPWTMANLGAALALGCAAAWRAFRATNPRRA